MTKTRTGRAGGGPLVVLLLLVAWAVASGGEATAPEPAIGPVPVVHSTADLALPLDAYQPTAEEYVTVQRAAWRLVRDCVHALGGEYTLTEASVVFPEGPRFPTPHERRYGLFDVDSAAVRGYNLAADQQPQVLPESARWNPGEAELLLVRGAPVGPGTTLPVDPSGRARPAGGCQGEATRTLAAGTAEPADPAFTDKLTDEQSGRAQGDSRVRAAMQRWSECKEYESQLYDDHANNVASSFRGRAGCWVRLYDNGNFTGATTGWIEKTPFVGSSMNDKASSLQVT